MHQTLIKKVIFLSLFCFLLGVMALTLHHHDNAFLLPACSICKVKTAFTGTIGKINFDSTPAAAIYCLSWTAIFLCLSGILPDGKTIFIDSRIVENYPNKAPPFTF
jgi:hypothetical protein